MVIQNINIKDIYNWCVAAYHHIECADYDGRERRVLRDTRIKLADIIIEDDFVYWTGIEQM